MGYSSTLNLMATTLLFGLSMQKDITELRATKSRDIYKVNFENKHDYMKAKYVLSRLNVSWASNDFTKTLYFLGKKL